MGEEWFRSDREWAERLRAAADGEVELNADELRRLADIMAQRHEWVERVKQLERSVRNPEIPKLERPGGAREKED